RLNNVLLQYFRGAPNISSTFRPSSILPGKPPKIISEQGVEALVRSLRASGKLSGFDFSNTVLNFILPKGVVLTLGENGGDRAKGRAKSSSRRPVEQEDSSLHGLGGFHGSVRTSGHKIYYAVGVFSEGNNGIVAFDQSWKNVVATFYHELVEARTDADVDDGRVAWVNEELHPEEIGDIPMTLAGADLGKVMKEVRLADGTTVPIQLMWSNAVGGPEGPIAKPH